MDPDVFQFPSQVNAPRGNWVTSDAAIIRGINTAAPISIENGEYAIDAGAFTSAAGSIDEGQSLTVRVMAADSFSRITHARVTIGSIAVDFEVTSELPDYAPDRVAYDGEDTVYLLNAANSLVFRWSIANERYLDAIAVGMDELAPTQMAYVSSQQRLYLGYSSGAIQYIDTASQDGAEVPFGNTPLGVGGLAAVGNFLLAQDFSGAWATHYIFNAAGTITHQLEWNYYSRDYAWDPVTSRVYFFRDAFGPNDLHFEVINQATGQITDAGETPYHGDYSIEPPIRVSPDGQHVLLGSGDLYNQSDLTWAGALGQSITDARWLADGSIVTLTTSGGQTTLRRLGGAPLATLEQLSYSGEALRVVGSDTGMVVLVINDGTVQFHPYVPNDDSDGDGVPNNEDAFPLDPAASVDSDHDGYPDAWNPGMNEDDSTTGLILDAYPQDSACYLPEHGDGTNCDYGATVPNYVPDQIVSDGDTIYLLSSGNRRVYRWSIATASYLNPYVIGIDQGFSTLVPEHMTYSSSQQRLYLGYSTGAIQYIDTSAPNGAELPFGNTAPGVGGLVAVGNFLLAQVGSSNSATHYIFNAAGTITHQLDSSYYSREYGWDPVYSRVYFFRDGIGPNDLHYEVINQASGQITDAGETPYHGSYSIEPPIRVSSDGQYVLLGTGDIYNEADLTWAGSLGQTITDARWLADGSLVTLTTSGNHTTLRRLSDSLVNLEQLSYDGVALRVVGSDAGMVVLVIDNGTVQFHPYVPNDDSDGDGVLNGEDAFPLDPAASVDSDHDGYPDAWNPGMSQSDSTTGLILDAYPQDSACYLPEHGDGVTCNYGATVPNYVPDQIVSDGDTIYLLSSGNRRVYRWSIATASYLNPYVIGIDQGFNVLVPEHMTYSSSQQRLYLGYSSGAIRYVDTSAPNGAEVPFGNTAMGLGGLSAVGNFLLAQDFSGAWATHYIFNAAGTITHQLDWNYYSRDYAWDPVYSRVYFFRDDSSPNDLHFEVINQATGQITDAGETPYHGSYSIEPPIRVSSDGQHVLLGSGDLYNQSDLTWAGSLGQTITDARWMADGSIVALTTSGNQTTLRRLSNALVNLEQLNYSGVGLRVVGSDAGMVILVIDNGTVQFHTYVPNDDSDGDGVLNGEDAFPLDPAASVDSDHDGYPDAWNPGMSEDDSTTGLVLDAYPNDSACFLPEHGDGVTCDPGATIPDYVPDQVLSDGDTIYLLSSGNRRVYRWSIATGSYLNPYVIGIDQGFNILVPDHMAYSSSQQRLYLGYSSGAIQYIDTSAPNGVETAFGNTAMGVGGLAAVGNFLLAQDFSGAWATHYIFNAAGTITHQMEWNYYSREYAWDPVTSRVYFFRDDTSPNDLHFEVINQATGQITDAGDSPYHGDYSIEPPIRVSTDGQFVLLGSGDLYNQSDLTWAGSLGQSITDARWLADGSIVTLTTSGNQTTLRRLSDSLVNVEQLSYSGVGLRVVGSDTGMVVLVIDNGTVQFHPYVPNDDSDGDGVPNIDDDFPLDPAASVDTDHDGYPDAWNPGMSQDDSTTGLVLDAYPQDSACYLPEHGDGVTCNYGATVPSYVPDQVLSDGDTIYLLSSGNRRVYRWSIATASYLNPYVVGIDQGFSDLAPDHMAYSSSQQRLYLGYSSGAIQYIDTSAPNGEETPFGNTALGVGGLAAVGSFLLAQDFSGAWATHYIFDAAGTITHQMEWNYYSREYAWDPVYSRVYFFRDDTSPNDLHFEVINQASGQITDAGETPYHGDYSIEPPIRVSSDGQHVLLGSGDLYNQSDLTWAGSLGQSIADAEWKDNLLVDVDASALLEIRDADTRNVLTSYQFSGQPIRMVFGQADAYLVHVLNNTTAFVKLPLGDQDLDSMPQWWEELYGLSDSNAADAAEDPDGDGANNATEYMNHTNPLVP